MDLGRRLTRQEADTALLGLGGFATAFGVTGLLFPRLAAAMLGFRARAVTRRLMRIVAVRDLALGGMLLAARSGGAEDKRRAAAAVAAAQFADMGLTAVLVSVKLASPWALIAVASAAAPTALTALAVYDNYRVE